MFPGTTTLFVLLLASQASAFLPSVFERTFELQGEGCSDFQWTVDVEAMTITYSWKSSPEAEWTAFGFSENGGMKGADITAVKSLGEAFQVEDLVSTLFAKPEKDVLQNVELLSATYDVERQIHVVARRDLDTCDRDDIKITSHKMYVVCASGSLSGGDLSYHGNLRSSGLVNIMLNEEALFEQSFIVSNDTRASQLSPGITSHGNVETATSPFPVDLQMENITLDPNVATSYRCQTMQVPLDLRVSAFEQVWGTGQSWSTDSIQNGNSWMHHTVLYSCEDPMLVAPEHRDGKPWDCIDDMPACSATLAYARGTGLVQAPAGLHVPVRVGTYVLLVHYENPNSLPVVNDRSGFRVWVEPPAQQTRTSPAGVVIHDALHDSILIEADPHRKEVTLEYLISADATRAHLPKGGVTVFGGVLHMHEIGIRGRVLLLRDGRHIMDVYDSLSYDFDRQTMNHKRYQLLPGDALVIQCTYKPLSDRDVRGGSSTKDEMCSYDVIWTPETPEIGRGMGAAVRLDEPFLKSNMGRNEVFAWYVNYTDYAYEPNPPYRNFQSLQNHRKNVCKIMTNYEIIMPTFEFADPAVCAQMVMIAAFLVASTLSIRAVNKRICHDSEDIRSRRYSVVYVGQIAFSVAALPSICMGLVRVLPDVGTYNVVDTDTYAVARSLIAAQAILYLLELFYRVKVRLSLVFHHLLASVTVIFLYFVQTKNYADLALQYGLVLLLLAVTEQSVYVVLLFRNLGYREKHPTAWSWICKISTFIYVLSRVVVIALMVMLLVRNSSRTATTWRVSNHSFSEWIDDSGIIGPGFVSATVSILLCGLIGSSAVTWKALVHMMKTTPNGDKEAVKHQTEDSTMSFSSES